MDMLKLVAKIAEKYARNTNTASWVFTVIHQPKCPAQLIKKDQYKKKEDAFEASSLAFINF